MARIRPYAPVRGVVVVLMGTAALAACATPQPRYAAKHPTVGPTPGQLPNGAGGRYKVGSPYEVGGVWYVPKEEPGYDQEGTATWYGQSHHLKTTANGEVFDRYALSGAHTTLPLPSIVEVTNLENNRSVQVRVNDRGPFKGGAVIDVSQEAARPLGFEQQGAARVRVRYVGPAPLGAPDAGLRHSAYTPTPTPAALPPAAPTASTGLNPGPVETPILSVVHQLPGLHDDWSARVPMGRFARPEEVAAVMAFLASDEAAYVTGVALPVDGGLTAHTGQPNLLAVMASRNP